MNERTRQLLAFFSLVAGVTALTYLVMFIGGISWLQAQVSVLWGIGIWLMWRDLVMRDE